MLTILHLITGLETGGAERMLSRLVRVLDRNRFQNVVVSMTDEGAVGAAITDAGVALRSLGMRRGWPDPRAILRLARIMAELRPAILQTWLYHADLLGLILWRLGFARHLVWNLRCTESSGNSVVRGILSRASRLPDAIIVNSHQGQRFHQSIGYDPRRWVHIPNGFDITALCPNPDATRRRSELGIPEGMRAVLLPARYDPMKDHATFLDAAEKLAIRHPDVFFVLAGKDVVPENGALAAGIAARGMGARIRLLGERNDLDELYPAFDLVTLASAYGEGFPNVLGEAMACGIPCVATDTGDNAEIIGDTGIIVQPRNPEALAAAWSQVLSLRHGEREALGARARARIVTNYNLDDILARYQAFYQEIGTETR